MENKNRKMANEIDVFLNCILISMIAGTWNLKYQVLGLELVPIFKILGISCFGLKLLDKVKNYKYEKLFNNLKLNIDNVTPKLINKKTTNYGYDLIFSLPVGLSTDDFKKKQLAIEQFLNAKTNICYNNKKLIIQAYTETLKHYYDYKYIKTKGIVEFIVGYTHGEKAIAVNLEKVVHLLIAGETGSGKSILLRTILTNLILGKNPKRLSLHLIDLKNGTEFNVFRKCKMVKTFSRTIEEAEKILNDTSKEVDRRYDLFYQNDVVDIQEYNKLKNIKKLDYQVVVIDEFADLQNEKDSISSIETLAAKARACGIHLIISTQRPDAKVLNGRIKANVPCVIGLKTMNGINSRIIIDKEGLERLRGEGHAILKYGDNTEFQSMYLSVQQAKNLIKHTYIEKNISLKTRKPIGQIKNFDFLKILEGMKNDCDK